MPPHAANASVNGKQAVVRRQSSRKKWIAYTRNYELYLMLLLPLAYYIIFHYLPMYGLQIAFKNFLPLKGINGSPWAGFVHFDRFFHYYNFWRIIGNTLGISLYSLAVGFFAPIVLALMLNEVKNAAFKKLVQNATYLPHFLSVVVVVGVMLTFTSVKGGIFNTIVGWFGHDPINFMIEPGYFKTLFVLSNVWENMGWNAIIYLAALAGINPELYEAAAIDGASKLKRLFNVSLPGIMPTIIVLLILRVGQLLNVGFEKILLMQNNATLSASDVISTYVYRTGLLESSFSFAAAVGLFNSVCNFIVLLLANYLARRVSSSSLW
ncbi:ABC transporter permease [Paenibacillus thalictri]|uniref:Sugar ABC transporter permease n=1 Tax=Paenibacillus thalictri TaxID=2527873 RepID=A0A4Q9E0J6_9BACL|nr:ABC transporter permease subunit [Paenibacillus thalictri]TBL81970.1 sugar ABC transporter permease [Paenibacillus thalictri]